LLLVINGPRAAAEPAVWRVEKIGTFTAAPADWQPANILEALTTLLGRDDAAIDPLGHFPPFQPIPLAGSLAVLPKNENIQFYQVTMHDGKAYRTALLSFYRSKTPIPDADQQQFFAESLSRKDRKNLEKKTNWFRRELQKEFAAQFELTGIGLSFLELSPLEFLRVNNKQAYSMSARLVVSLHGLNLPQYVRGYAFDANGRLAVAFLATSDSERRYWDPLVKTMIESFAPPAYEWLGY